jgi:hypothetical protein
MEEEEEEEAEQEAGDDQPHAEEKYIDENSLYCLFIYRVYTKEWCDFKSELLVAQEKRGQLTLLTVYVLPV